MLNNKIAEARLRTKPYLELFLQSKPKLMRSSVQFPSKKIEKAKFDIQLRGRHKRESLRATLIYPV